MKRCYLKTSGIYAIRHIESGKLYVGSTKSFHQRCKSHCNNLKNNKHHCRHLQNAFNKYGADAFEFVILESCLYEPTILFAREQYWLDKYKNKKLLYNTVSEAEVGYGGITTEHKRKVLREKMLGNTYCRGRNIDRKYTSDDIRLIFLAFANGEPLESIAARHGMHRMYVFNVVSRNSRTFVEIDPEIAKQVQDRLRDRALGSEGARPKLTKELVLEIDNRIQNGERLIDLYTEYGLSRATLNRIKHRKAHKALLTPSECRTDHCSECHQQSSPAESTAACHQPETCI